MVTDNNPNWLRDEMTHPGVDFADPAEVDAYTRMVKDSPDESESTVRRLDLQPEHTLIDLGAGAGGFAVHAASFCKRVYAVDVSEPILALAREKADAAGVTNVRFIHAGFLTYEHTDEPVDAIVSRAALHHLPDAWKQVALTRLAAMLTDGGRLQLKDVVYRFAPSDYVAALDRFVDSVTEHFGPEMGPMVETSVRDEFHTWDWIMEGILRRSGFRIDMADYCGGLAEYLCTKEART